MNYVTLVLALFLSTGILANENYDLAKALSYSHENLAAVKKALAYGARLDIDIGQPGFPGQSPLMVASEKGFVNVVKLFIRKGDKVNRQNKHGWSALRYAAEAGQVQVIKTLVAGGADINIRDEFETTPLFAAVQAAQLESVKILIKLKADVNLTDHFNRTVLDIAIYEKNQDPSKIKTEIVSVLLKAGAKPSVKDTQP